MSLQMEYFLGTSDDGVKIINIKENNINICLGKKDKEQENIKEFVYNLNIPDGESLIFIFGLGSGEYIKELINNIGYGNKVYIFEPEEIIYNNIMADTYINSMLKEDSRINIFYFKNKNQIMNILNRYVDKSYLNKYVCSHYTNYEKVFLNKFNMFSEAIKEFWIEVGALRASNIMFSNIVIENYINNIKEIEKNTNANELKNSFLGSTAIIVSSGPSLEKNIKFLKEYKDNCIIICASRSIQELIKNEMAPDFICAIDPGEIMEKLFKQSMDLEIPMVVTEQVNFNIVKNYKGKKIFVLNSFKNIIEKMCNEEYISIPVGGSVAHLATAFAVFLGAKNVIFIGQDLAFTNNKYHSTLSTNENLIKEKANFNKNDLFYVEGNVEEKVLTNNSFITFKNWFEVFISNNRDVNFINSTEGGAKIRGTKIMPLQDSLSIYCKERINKNVVNLDTTKNIEGVIIKYLNRQLQCMNELTLKGIEYSNKMINYYEGNKNVKINNVLKKLDDIDLKLYKTEEIIYMLNLFKYKEMEMLNNKDEYREKIDESEREAGIRLGKRSLQCYKIYNNGIKEIMSKF
ncbi:MAG: 6-hydroxymethylpterin diphosphokinase MptE-like protein [Clostridiaceae bacterium]